MHSLKTLIGFLTHTVLVPFIYPNVKKGKLDCNEYIGVAEDEPNLWKKIVHGLVQSFVLLRSSAPTELIASIVCVVESLSSLQR